MKTEYVVRVNFKRGTRQGDEFFETNVSQKLKDMAGVCVVEIDEKIREVRGFFEGPTEATKFARKAAKYMKKKEINDARFEMYERTVSERQRMF